MPSVRGAKISAHKRTQGCQTWAAVRWPPQEAEGARLGSDAPATKAQRMHAVCEHPPALAALHGGGIAQVAVALFGAPALLTKGAHPDLDGPCCFWSAKETQPPDWVGSGLCPPPHVGARWAATVMHCMWGLAGLPLSCTACGGSLGCHCHAPQGVKRHFNGRVGGFCNLVGLAQPAAAAPLAARAAQHPG